MIDDILSRDAFWIVNKKLSRKIGIVPTLVLAELLFYRKQFGNDFYKNVEHIEESLGIGRAARRSAFGILEKHGILEVTKRGNPARNFYTINDSSVFDILREATKEPSSEVTTDPSREVTSDPTYTKNINKKDNKKEDNTASLIKLAPKKKETKEEVMAQIQTGIDLCDKKEQDFDKTIPEPNWTPQEGFKEPAAWDDPFYPQVWDIFFRYGSNLARTSKLESEMEELKKITPSLKDVEDKVIAYRKKQKEEDWFKKRKLTVGNLLHYWNDLGEDEIILPPREEQKADGLEGLC